MWWVITVMALALAAVSSGLYSTQADPLSTLGTACDNRQGLDRIEHQFRWGEDQLIINCGDGTVVTLD